MALWRIQTWGYGGGPLSNILFLPFYSFGGFSPKIRGRGGGGGEAPPLDPPLWPVWRGKQTAAAFGPFVVLHESTTVEFCFTLYN